MVDIAQMGTVLAIVVICYLVGILSKQLPKVKDEMIPVIVGVVGGILGVVGMYVMPEFERCVDVLAELIEKYAGLFALNDIGYEYYVIFASMPIATSVHSLEDYKGRCRWYWNRFELKRNVINHNAKNQIDRIAG